MAAGRALVCLAGFTAIAAAQSTTFSYTGSVQTYTVPPGVSQITIDAAGAAGGAGLNGGTAGGLGARLAANFLVTPGETLNVVVGGMGSTGNVGGGGGSFVYRAPTVAGLLIAAAGAGAGGFTSTGTNGKSSMSASSGNTGGAGGVGGNGGMAGTSSMCCNGGGGGGLFTPGATSPAPLSGSGGMALATGAAGGSGNLSGNGGFGGGGGGGYDGGGGGGGFNGGGGGSGFGVDGGGGGGGSFSASIPTIATDGFESGDGYVIITVSGFVPTDAYQISYANVALADSFINLTNDGATDPATSPGTICANVYVFDPNEEELDCCSCLITPNALQSLSVKTLLTNNLTPEHPTSATVALLGSAPSGSGTCDPSAVTTATLVPGLRAWSTTVHSSGPPANLNYGTELPFAHSGSTLSGGELNELTGLCSFIRANGSGSGQCSGCVSGGQ